MSQELYGVCKDAFLCEAYDQEVFAIAKAFYQAYRLTGTINMKFDVRSMADSDGNSVVNVYVSPRDLESSATLQADTSTRHLQLLESMVPAAILGYQFLLRIIPEGANNIRMEALETVPPLTY